MQFCQISDNAEVSASFCAIIPQFVITKQRRTADTVPWPRCLPGQAALWSQTGRSTLVWPLLICTSGTPVSHQGKTDNGNLVFKHAVHQTTPANWPTKTVNQWRPWVYSTSLPGHKPLGHQTYYRKQKIKKRLQCNELTITYTNEHIQHSIIHAMTVIIWTSYQYHM